MKSIRTTGTARVGREWKIIERRIQLYCQREHHRDGLCGDCRQLLEAYRLRLRDCRYRADKPICANCAFRCFLPGCREQLNTVIGATRQYMVLHHPHMAMRHWLDSFHRAPAGLRINYSCWGGE